MFSSVERDLAMDLSQQKHAIVFDSSFEKRQKIADMVIMRNEIFKVPSAIRNSWSRRVQAICTCFDIILIFLLERGFVALREPQTFIKSVDS